MYDEHRSLSQVADLGNLEVFGLRGALKRAGCFTLINETEQSSSPDAYGHCDIKFLPGTLGIMVSSTRFKHEGAVVVRSQSGEPWAIRAPGNFSKDWDWSLKRFESGYLAKFGHVLQEQGEDTDVTSQRYVVYTEGGMLRENDEWVISESPPAIWVEGQLAPKTVPLGNSWVQFAEGSVGKSWTSGEWGKEVLYVTLPSGANVMLVEMSLIHEVKQHAFFYRDPWIEAWQRLIDES